MPREQIISIAQSQVGIKENPPGSNKSKYGAWFGLDGQPWCAMFVSWVYAQAGVPLGRIDTNNGYASCQHGYLHWKASGELTGKPQPGDIVLFDWKGDGHCDHTGLFVSWVTEGELFNTIEGNTAVGNDSNGGEVMERQRRVASVKAFVSPAVLGDNPNAIVADDTLKRGMKGSDVARLQKKLYDLGYTIVVDGDYGPDTEAVVKQYEHDNNLPETGIASAGVQHRMYNNNVAATELSTGSFLHKGDAGAAVLALQQALQQAGMAVTPDGVFGNETLAALMQYQQQQGLDADGIAGPATFHALNMAMA